MARHLSVQTIVFTRNAQISVILRGSHTAMGFLRLKLLLRFTIRPAQDKMIAYNHLVANLVILHNVDAMSKAINKLKRQGFQVDAEALSSLSPYRTEHINLLETYSLKIPTQQTKRHFKLV